MKLNFGYNASYSRKVKKFKVGEETYDSGFEASYARELFLRKAAGEITGFIPHPELKLVINGYKVCTYTPDFLVEYPDGTKQYIETKGWPNERFKIVWKLFYALYADLPDFRLPLMVMQGSHIVKNPKKIV